MTKRYYVVKHTLTVIHEGESWRDNADDDQLGVFHFAENHCVENVIADLYERQQDGVCTTCCGHKAEYVGRYDSVEAAQAANPMALHLKSESGE